MNKYTHMVEILDVLLDLIKITSMVKLKAIVYTF